MRFEIKKDDKSKKAEFKVQITVQTKCVITKEDGTTVAWGEVNLNHKDHFDLRIGTREALKQALNMSSSISCLTPSGRAAFWKAYCEAFGIQTKEFIQTI